MKPTAEVYAIPHLPYMWVPIILRPITMLAALDMPEANQRRPPPTTFPNLIHPPLLPRPGPPPTDHRTMRQPTPIINREERDLVPQHSRISRYKDRIIVYLVNALQKFEVAHLALTTSPSYTIGTPDSCSACDRKGSGRVG
ncbi:hypothetical protein K458DRAFT_417752, partial [Lentithecium fluviatile CBS 122367]